MKSFTSIPFRRMDATAVEARKAFVLCYLTNELTMILVVGKAFEDDVVSFKTDRVPLQLYEADGHSVVGTVQRGEAVWVQEVNLVLEFSIWK